MRIKSIQLRNKYKRFHDLTINLGDNPKKIIALVGPNGSGKSSVFDGMLFLQNAYSQIGSFSQRDHMFHSMDQVPIDHSSIIIMFDTNELYTELRERKAQVGTQQTIFSFRNSYRYHAELNVGELKALSNITANNIGATSSIDLDEKIKDNYQRIYVHLNKLQKDEDLRPSEAKARVLAVLNESLSNVLGLTISDLGDIQARKGTIFFKKNNQEKEFEFTVLSSGEKEVVDILLDIFLRRAEYNDTIYIIDEPELHISSAIQRKLLIEIERFIPDTCQLWVATHSIGFLNALQNELTDKSDIIDFSGNLSQEAKTLEPMKKTRENWRKIFETALEDLTGLLAPARIIYCEGKHEPGANGQEQGLDAEVYNKIFSETHSDTLFVSSGGHTNPDKYAAVALKVLGKAFQGVQLLLLKDRDINSDGTPTTLDQRTQWIAEAPDLRKMLVKKEIENYLFDYEIVHHAYPNFDKTAYDVVIPDINADDVKERGGALLQALGINTGLNADGLKKRLAGFVTPDTAVYIELNTIIFG